MRASDVSQRPVHIWVHIAEELRRAERHIFPTGCCWGVVHATLRLKLPWDALDSGQLRRRCGQHTQRHDVEKGSSYYYYYYYYYYYCYYYLWFSFFVSPCSRYSLLRCLVAVALFRCKITGSAYVDVFTFFHGQCA
jgi:hypothetical protein